GLLSWRKYSKPEAKLFCIKGFLAMEGFLFTQIFWGMLRVLDCFILIYDYFPKNMILREMLFTVSWLLGSISVTTYLAGILRTIPRMHFYRQNPEYKTLYLPSLQNTTIIYFCYIFTIGITLTTCSFFIGYLETNPNSIVIAYVLKSVEFSVFAICCFLMSFGYIIYGSKLISIASEGIHLLEGVNDYQSHIKSKNSRNTTHSLSGLELEIKHKRLKRSVRKVVTNNRIILAASAIFCKQLYENLISNKVFAAFTNLFPMLVNVAVMAGIAYGEMTVHNKYEIGFENNITSSISTNNPLPPRESIETIAVHTRDPSTDSESPLLLLPPPVILSTIKKMFSISQNTFDSVSTDWLAENIDDTVIPVDGSWYMPNANKDPHKEYLDKRIKNARFFGIDTIKDNDTTLPHMLPSAEKFAEAMGKLGISETDYIICYDAIGVFSSPRIYWTLKPKVYKIPEVRTDLIRTYEQIRKNIKEGPDSPNYEQLIDARPEPRPGLPSGHMPYSISLPFDKVIDPKTKRTLLDDDSLKKLIESKSIDLEKPIVLSCGSGITASILYVALEKLGAKKLSVYDGSWTEYASKEDSPDWHLDFKN
ncbi:2383_t:CDS:10, partial [Entrophospora sp. SA101]